MKVYFKIFGCLLVLTFVIAVLGAWSKLLDFSTFAFFNPKIEQVRYDTFKESQSYNEGMLRDLENIKMQYLAGNAEQKQALKSIAIHRFSVYPFDKLPADLQAFYTSLKGN